VGETIPGKRHKRGLKVPSKNLPFSGAFKLQTLLINTLIRPNSTILMVVIEASTGGILPGNKLAVPATERPKISGLGARCWVSILRQ
jgi:hypothetical protein